MAADHDEVLERLQTLRGVALAGFGCDVILGSIGAADCCRARTRIGAAIEERPVKAAASLERSVLAQAVREREFRAAG
jgi:hypothetical protein